MLIDDHELIRRALSVSLKASGVAAVVGEADCAEVALLVVLQFQPDIIIIDLRLPDEDGISLTRKMRSAGVTSKILLMSGDAGPSLIEAAFIAGVDGFVSKLSSAEVVLTAVRSLQCGNRFVDPTVAFELIDPLRIRLSDREHEVLNLLVEGCQNEAIAFRMSISMETVKTHVSNILRKLKVDSRGAAATAAIRKGFVL